jgi:hypothetical protein
MGNEAALSQASGHQKPPEPGPEYDLELLESIPNGTIFAYNLDERETPGGMKVRWKIRVVTGPEAARVDARQAEAIREALSWLRKQQAKTARP